VIVSNTTPLFAFAALGRFDLLEKVHGRIVVVETVVRECEVGGPIIVPDLRLLPWILILPAPHRADIRFQKLDAGERDTLSIAMEQGASKVLIDERLGRNLAEAHGLSVVGTLGTLLKAR
jgi:predicted nucleic acid-binding protein